MSEERTQNLPKDPLTRILSRLDSIDSRLNRIDARLDGLDARLTALEDKVDKRLQETRPIWERALAEIAETRAEMREGFVKVNADVGKLRTDTEAGLYRVERQIEVLHLSIQEVRTDLRYLDIRITKLESEPAQ